jgi:hypothetical protein
LSRRLVTVLATMALVLGLASPASAGTSPQGLHNSVFAHVTRHDPDSQLLAWAEAQTDHHAVTAINEARAFSHDCDGCTAEAVSFQIVLASGTNLYTLTNTATSVTLECIACTTVSVAEQWVVGATDGTVVLSQAGQTALEAVQAQLATEVALPPSEGLAGILAAADEVSAILAAEVSVVPSQATVPGPTVPAVSPLAQTAPSSSPTIQHFSQVST